MNNKEINLLFYEKIFQKWRRIKYCYEHLNIFLIGTPDEY